MRKLPLVAAVLILSACSSTPPIPDLTDQVKINPQPDSTLKVAEYADGTGGFLIKSFNGQQFCILSPDKMVENSAELSDPTMNMVALFKELQANGDCTDILPQAEQVRIITLELNEQGQIIGEAA